MSFSFSSRAWPCRIIGALLTLMLLSGCSAVRLSYNNADTIAYWWLDGYADFDEAQARQTRIELTRLHRWHRANELPAYATLLEQARQLASDTVTAAEVCRLSEQIRQYALRLGEQATLGLAEVAPTLKPEQLSHMARHFDKRNGKWRDEWLDIDAAALAKRRLKKNLERAEDFYGRLEDAQIAQLRQSIAQSTYDPRLAWQERLRRQQDMLQTLREQSTAPRTPHAQADMHALVRRSLDSPDPTYRAQFRRIMRETCDLIATLHNSASPAQRSHLLDKLRDYEEDARVLAGQK